MSAWRTTIFLLIVVTITFAWHYYLYVRLFRTPILPPPIGTIAGYVILGLALLMPASFFLMRALSRGAAAPLMWVAFIWMGLAFVLFTVLVVFEPIRVAVLSRVPDDPERRVFLMRAMAGVVGAIGVAVSGVGIANALARVRVVPVRIPIRGLRPEGDGYRIVQWTDVHVGPTIGREFIEQIVASTNALSPDMVVITGDLVDGSVDELGALLAPIKNLKTKDGVYFVTGNHEYYSGADEWIAYLGTLGVRVLRNERTSIRGLFELAGVDDESAHMHGHGTDVAKALAARDTSVPIVLLAHQPKTILRIGNYGVALQLSGHTHGGQIWPWGYAVKLDQPHVAGLHDHNGTWIYVSRGTGYWGPPMRIGAPAEITQIELSSANV